MNYIKLILAINSEEEEENKLYNFDFFKFFEKENLEIKTESSESQKSFITSSSVPK